MRTIAAAFAATLLAAMPAAAQDFSKVEIRTLKLSERTYMLSGAGGNIGLSVGDDAVFLVDDQYAPLTQRIKAAIAAITPRPVRFVLNTHWHGDHTGGNENLGKEGAVIIAHENVRKRLSTEQFLEHLRRHVQPSPPAALPVVTFTSALTFHLNGDELRVIHAPRAHTDGDAMVLFMKSDVIHMGDVFWNGMYPVIDTGSGGTIEGVLAACDQVLGIASDRTRIIPGHGPLSNKAGLQAYRDMLATLHGRIKAMIDQGRKLEEITASGVSKDFDEKWGKGFIPPHKFAEMVAMNIIRSR